MLLIDYSQVFLSNLMMQVSMSKDKEISVDLIRHMVLTSLLSYKKQFGNSYGRPIFCVDHKKTWRKQTFVPYKANRKKSRDKSGYNWQMIFDTRDLLITEIKENFNYKVIQVEGAEADDIIATLVKQSQADESFESFGLSETKEPVLIVSGDKDFMQLQKFDNVKQWAPVQKRFFSTNDPKKFLKEHILRGDESDGIPNFLSDDDTFTCAGKRQTSIYQKKLDLWLDMDVEEFCDAKMLRNYHRNRQLIDFDCIPEEITQKILRENELIPEAPVRLEGLEAANKSNKIMEYFMRNKLRILTKSIGDFL